MKKYPDIFDEWVTMGAIVDDGKNLARFGDGELKMSEGESYRRQVGSVKLATELSMILTKPHPNCLVGIPTMDPAGPKFPNWDRHRERFLPKLSSKVVYYSAFVSRPDSAPSIEVRKYAELVQQLWVGRRVAVVCERKGSLHRAVRMSQCKAYHVECPTHQAYDIIDQLEMRVLGLRPDVAVLSAGPSATCLANRLAKEGVHAVDLGSIGAMLCRLLK